MWLNIIVCAALASFHIVATQHLHSKLKRKEEEAELLAEERRQERQGRTKAERQLREVQLQLAQATSTNPQDSDQHNQPPDGPIDFRKLSFPLRPIGTLHSCFDKRNGTPRQPLLVPAARACLTLRPELSAEYFEGLKDYTHCWILYVFHENTDLQRLWEPKYASIKAKIRVPRLNGQRLGAFATRSPHRPCPIGLSVAEIIAVEGSLLILGGADIVNGSPVLDIKPYVPFCDNVEAAKAPSWVAPTAEDEPLEISAVEISTEVDVMLKKGWEESAIRQKRKRPLYRKYAEFKDLVLQVLSRDIRSVTQRVRVPEREQQGAGVPALFADATGGPEEGKWHVELDGVDITYEVEENKGKEKRVIVKTAKCVWQRSGGGSRTQNGTES